MELKKDLLRTTDQAIYQGKRALRDQQKLGCLKH